MFDRSRERGNTGSSKELEPRGISMLRQARLLGAVIAVGASVVVASPAKAQSDLGGTSWDATNDACDIDGIDFRSDGTASVYDLMADDEDTAHWTLDGNTLHLKYDGWYGGIEGSIYDDNRLEATETWRSKETQEIHNDPCIFKKK